MRKISANTTKVSYLQENKMRMRVEPPNRNDSYVGLIIATKVLRTFV